MTQKKIPTRLRRILSATILSLFLICLQAGVVMAEVSGTGTTNPPASGSTGVSGSAAVGMPIPLAGVKIPKLIGMIIQYILGFTGVIALLMFVYGGLTWMLAQGNQEKITQAKNTLVWATIGIILVFSSYALTKFIMGIVCPECT